MMVQQRAAGLEMGQSMYITAQQASNQHVPADAYASAQVCLLLFGLISLHLHLQDLAAELEKERTDRVIAQQAANQEKLQARASAAESASLRRHLKELAERLDQEKHNAAAPAAQFNPANSEDGLVSKLLNIYALIQPQKNGCLNCRLTLMYI